jgi:hypothetical protein
MFTIFSPLERVLPTIPHPIQGQYDFYHCSSIAGSFSNIYSVKNIPHSYTIEIFFFKHSKDTQCAISTPVNKHVIGMPPDLSSSWSVSGKKILNSESSIFFFN